VAFTSALPNEGKTTVSLSFSRVNAIMGSRTLLIDCDLRRAGLRNIVGPNANGGLVDVLNGTLTLKQAIVADEVANLDLLLVNAPHFTAENLVGDQRMQALIEEAKQSYDQIVLDLSPLLGLVDARLLSALADVTCFIVRWGKTPPSAVEMALSTLHAHEANVAGAIYSMVDTRADVLGGSFYSKHYANYYEED
jgi:capsular exopolysaccharide synthesis family protein